MVRDNITSLYIFKTLFSRMQALKEIGKKQKQNTCIKNKEVNKFLQLGLEKSVGSLKKLFWMWTGD